jgi:endonuclease/exonuclease/phosphatase family metal-dependent hydrolase
LSGEPLNGHDFRVGVALPRSLAIITTAIAAVAAAVAFAISGSAHATGFTQTYLQLNMCGNACNHGGFAVTDNIEATVGERTPTLVTLNEVCENQYDRLQADLTAYRARFDPTGPTCQDGARYGNALFARTTDLTFIGSWLLPNPAEDEARRLMCLHMRVPGQPAVVVCVTHISSFLANVGPQVSAAAGILNGLDTTDPVLLAGDFNTDPGDARMNPLYNSCYAGGIGHFREADSTGCARRSALDQTNGTDVFNQETFPRHKYDDIFLVDGGWCAVRADVIDAAGGLSDHHAEFATATLAGSPVI